MLRDFLEMKIKINQLNGQFWFNTSIYTTSSRRWVARPYKTLKKLLQIEHLVDKDFLLSINGDKDLKVFRFAQEKHGINVYINQKQLEIIKDEGSFDYPLGKINVTLKYDDKGVKLFKKGFIPFYSKSWYQTFFKAGKNKPTVYLVWRRNGWKELKNK